VPRIYSSARKQFIDYALSINTNKCILWPFAIRKSSGYGAFDIRENGRKINVDIHRYICKISNGIPELGKEAAHTCGNRICINPHHLYWASHLQNMQDAISHKTLKGGGIYRQRIYEEDRQKIIASKEHHRVWADKYDVSIQHISEIRRKVK